MQNAIIIVLIAAAVLLGLRESIKHFRGEGGCCGGASAKPRVKKLKNKVIHTYVLRIEGMHCQNCVNAVTRIINDFDGAAGKVSLRNGKAKISCDRDIDLALIKNAIQEHGYEVPETGTM